DAQGYDCDYNCRNTLIQYNYSHDNYGGMVLICDSGNERNYSIGNKGSIVRYNISIGDGQRPKATRQGMFSPNIHIAGRVEETLVERNIIHSNPKTAADADRTMVCSDSWDGYADRTTFKENIFYTAEPSRFEMNLSTHNDFLGNWYLGRYTDLPTDANARKASDKYQRTIIDADPTGFKALESLMDKKTTCGAECHFVNKELIEKFFAEMD
ncbi:MAG: right-handed parallel beta-helix repeat-containing protein, partial [Prevotella sp.]